MKLRKRLLALAALVALASLFFIPHIYAVAGPIGPYSSALSAAQFFWGDGAVYSDGYLQAPPVNTSGEKCLECHQAGTGISDKTSYLRTGHGNMLKMVSANQIWNGATGTPHSATNPYGHPIDWSTGTGRVNLGGYCDVGGFEGQFDKAACEATTACTLAVNNFFSPAYTKTTCEAGGGLWKLGVWTAAERWVDITYFVGDWMGSAAGHIDTGITGATLPANKFMMADGRQYGTCGSCHNTGYIANDYSRPQPFADYPGFPRSSASGVLGSWVLNGIQCERCHDATPRLTGGKPTVPRGANATSLCSQCHIRTAAYEGAANPQAATQPTAYPIGASATNFGTHLIGKQFLNSPHGLFTGPYAEIGTTTEGLYKSSFSDGSSQGGCDTCHDVHQSTVAQAKEKFGAEPIKKGCETCHPAEAAAIWRTHRAGPGTMLPTGTSADISGACITCHMPKPAAGAGLNVHVFRINTDPNYSTFPKPGATTPGYCSDPTWSTRAECVANGKSWSLVAYSSPYGDYTGAVWVDVDLACGQCHVGSGAAGRTAPINGARQIGKADLAKYATLIHGNLGTTIHATAKENGSISPAGTTKVSSGGSQTYTMTPAAGYMVRDVLVDGISRGPIPTYTFANVTNSHTIVASFWPASFAIVAATSGVEGSGSITPSGATTVSRGSSQTYTMTPGAGFTLSYVVVDGRNVGAPATYTFSNVTSSHTIKAYFKLPPAPPTSTFTITASASGADGSGSITPSGVTTVNRGDSQTYTMNAGPGYQVSYVLVDGMRVGAPTTYTFANVTQSHTIKVYYKLQ